MKIVQAPEPVLSHKTKSIGKITPEILKLIEDMKDTLVNTTDPEGVGLAAPQVGKSLQLFIIKPETKSPFTVFINPEIVHIEKVKHTKIKSDEDQKLEGCLSLKNIWGVVERAPKVTMKYMDEKGEKHEQTFDGFFATILQHEYDHLQGFLFPKRVLEQKGKLYKSHKDEKGEEVFEEINI
jgi:peptide deformylase